MYDFPDKPLFKWQQDCLRLWFDNDCKGIVNVVTGAGKTVLALAAAYNLRQNEKTRVKIVVPKVFLATQWQKSLMEELHIPRDKIGIYRNPQTSCTLAKDFMLYVVNSARYSISRHILADMKAGYSILLICDECHHYGSEENSKIFDFLPHINDSSRYYALGLSATPQSENYTSVLVPALGREIYNYGFGDAIKENIISEYGIFNIAINFNSEESDEYAEITDKISKSITSLKKKNPYLFSLSGISFFRALRELTSASDKSGKAARMALMLMYKRKKIVCSAKSRLDCACDIVAALSRSDRIIIFAEQIKITEMLYKKLSTLYPGQAARYHSEMSNAAKLNALNAYRDFEVRLLLCCRALDEGLNVPATDVGIILSSTGSKRQRVQRIGRILRRCSEGGSKNVYYLHVAESSEEDGLVTEEIYRDMPVWDLNYDSVEGDFWCDSFEDTFVRVIDSAAQKGASAEVLDELSRNLKLILIRGDSRCSAEQCMKNISCSKSVVERNYWISALKVADSLI